MENRTFEICKDLIFIINNKGIEVWKHNPVFNTEDFVKHFKECNVCKKTLIDLYENNLSEKIPFIVNSFITNLFINKLKNEVRK